MRLRFQNQYGNITDNPLAIGATSMSSAKLNGFPAVSPPNYCVALLDSGTSLEIIYFMAHGQEPPKGAPQLRDVTAASTLPAGIYQIVATYVTADGETAASFINALAIVGPNTHQISATVGSYNYPIPAGVTSVKFYLVATTSGANLGLLGTVASGSFVAGVATLAVTAPGNNTNFSPGTTNTTTSSTTAKIWKGRGGTADISHPLNTYWEHGPVSDDWDKVGDTFAKSSVLTVPPGAEEGYLQALYNQATKVMHVGIDGSSIAAGGRVVTDQNKASYYEQWRTFLLSLPGVTLAGDFYSSIMSGLPNGWSPWALPGTPPWVQDVVPTLWGKSANFPSPVFSALTGAPYFHFTSPYACQSFDIIYWEFGPFITSVSTGTSSTTLTDTSLAMQTNQFIGATIHGTSAGAACTGVITANTATVFTVTSWTGGTPTSGTPYWVTPDGATFSWTCAEVSGGATQTSPASGARGQLKRIRVTGLTNVVHTINFTAQSMAFSMMILGVCIYPAASIPTNGLFFSRWLAGGMTLFDQGRRDQSPGNPPDKLSVWGGPQNPVWTSLTTALTSGVLPTDLLITPALTTLPLVGELVYLTSMDGLHSDSWIVGTGSTSTDIKIAAGQAVSSFSYPVGNQVTGFWPDIGWGPPFGPYDVFIFDMPNDGGAPMMPIGNGLKASWGYGMFGTQHALRRLMQAVQAANPITTIIFVENNIPDNINSDETTAVENDMENSATWYESAYAPVASQKGCIRVSMHKDALEHAVQLGYMYYTDAHPIDGGHHRIYVLIRGALPS